MKFPKFSLNFGGFSNKFQDFQWVLTFFEGLGYVRAKWIYLEVRRLNDKLTSHIYSLLIFN